MKKLAIIGGGIAANDYIEACNRIGYEAHYFTPAYCKIENNNLSTFHDIDIFDKEGIVRICRDLQISGVVATTELTVAIAAYVADRLNLPGNDVQIAEVITDKIRNRECIKHLDTLKPVKYLHISGIRDFDENPIQFPVIVKPATRGGKQGLSVAHNREELKSSIEYAVPYFKEGVVPKIIVEEFLEGGTEYSVESISIMGKHYIVQITKKDSSGPPHCVELGHHQPAPLSEAMWLKVTEAIADGLYAIGIRHGACHTEIKIIDNEIYVIEFNARHGGDHISNPLVLLSTGFDYMAALAKVATGDLKEIDTSNFEKNYAGLYYVVEQTAHLKPIFDICQIYDWCYLKHEVTSELEELKTNNLPKTNHFIYYSKEGNPIARILTDRKDKMIKKTISIN